MPSSNFLKHPVLTVSIGGKDVDTQPSLFKLTTDAGILPITARLAYPRDAETGEAGDEVSVSLVAGEERVRYFTGTVWKAYEEGKLRMLELTDGYEKLCSAKVTPAYRKETAKAILQDALDAAGIAETSITCPAVEIGRFSTRSISASWCIAILIRALEEHGVTGLRYFFDAEDVFHFGTVADTGRNEGEVFGFESRKDIIGAGDGYIEVMPFPIRHSQSITVDGVAMLTVRTELVISRNRSRLILWVKAA